MSLDRRAAGRCGMTLAWHAREVPDQPAILSPAGDRSFDQLNARANQIVRALRVRGLRAGDRVALMCSNRPEFAEVYAAVQRSGLHLIPINWHFTGPEIAYIANDCNARALIGDVRYAEALTEAAAEIPKTDVRLVVGGSLAGFERYDEVLERESTADVEDAEHGSTMFYTSGTTGRPKGVDRPASFRSRPGLALVAKHSAYRRGEDLNLCTGPLYHAAPLAFSLAGPLTAGVGVVLMDGWDSEGALALIERHRITHTHMVPTMFHRLLSLPAAARTRHDLSSLRMILHGAAPCPIAIKRALIEWLGPIVYEYYAATEGWGSFVTSEMWLERPGTVGLPQSGQVRIADENGGALPPGEVGKIYMRAPPEDRFAYHKDPEKTHDAYDASGEYFTLGDVGYVDKDGYLYLTDRSADVIISGGVNTYPAEVDAVLLSHPSIADSATIGAPNKDWGEEVRAVVELKPGIEGTDALAHELIAFCRERLAHYKCPRAVDFVSALPREDSGKIFRRRVREKYWVGREKRI
ncbi:MAG: acyl-CoA synthase [Deltaproteobacteria bacterium]|nr:MAG: acyl-CoA synthase [Deltaproteobacteria bacterium]